MEKMNWNNLDAIKQFNNLKIYFGNPSILANEKSGIAIWTKNDLQNKKIFDQNNCFEEVIIRDEMIEHLCPAKHHDFLYSSIIVGVEPNKFYPITLISESLTYDALKNYLTARCASIEANIATLKLATDLLLENDVNYDQFDIHYNNIDLVRSTGAYGKLINATKDETFVKKLYSELCGNIKKLSSKTELNKGYWKRIFSIENDQCLPADKPDKTLKKGGRRQSKKIRLYASKTDKPDKALFGGKRRSRRNSLKKSRKGSRKGSRKISRKISKKTSRKTSRKGSRKGSRKISRKASRNSKKRSMKRSRKI